jgi:4a-hydroxytetrahydrobiopterin dehydratase
MSKLTGQQIADEGLDGWAYLLGGMQTRILTKDFATGLAVVNAIGAAAEEMNHHPDLDLRYTHVDVRLTSHDVRAVTDRDIRLARVISSIAADAGARLESSNVSGLELALDTPAGESVLPFWAAVLAMEHPSGPGIGDELRDPADALPAVWFQTVRHRSFGRSPSATNPARCCCTGRWPRPCSTSPAPSTTPTRPRMCSQRARVPRRDRLEGP